MGNNHSGWSIEAFAGHVKIILVYIAVTNGGSRTEDLASRFAATYYAYPPGVYHDTLVICNGGPLSTALGLLFEPLHPQFFPRVNDEGWDISAFIAAAQSPCRDYDMMLCCGESVHFHREDWLRRIVDAWDKYGPGMYGPFGSFSVRAHLQTTAFACAPPMLRAYPKKVQNQADRYEFEHGEKAFWRKLEAEGFPVMLVTWDGEWEPRRWRDPKNILWSGDQSNCLMRANHSDNWEMADPARKDRWSRSANQPFR